MSERGTYVTSFLYDGRLGPILKRHLEDVTRKGTMMLQLKDASTDIRFIAGMMHGSYPGEERSQMRDCVESILADLPKDHGVFSIVVMPEHEANSAVFAVADLKLLEKAQGPPDTDRGGFSIFR